MNDSFKSALAAIIAYFRTVPRRLAGAVTDVIARTRPQRVTHPTPAGYRNRAQRQLDRRHYRLTHRRHHGRPSKLTRRVCYLNDEVRFA